ncbi:MAG: zf-HC2 domain-containing protein [Elusimicrobia bacterium]|nr:zf-HC2 domain-containing protein [Elusimicrobiota bacterium]
MECDRMRESLESYAAGRLPAAEASRLEAHLQVCPACSRELRWVRVLKAAVRGVPRPALPADLRAALMRQARAAAQPRPAWLESWRFSWRLAAGFGCASAFAAAVAVLAVSRFSTGTEELSLDEVLEAHSRYELTMPAADRDALFTGLSLRLSQEGGRHD